MTPPSTRRADEVNPAARLRFAPGSVFLILRSQKLAVGWPISEISGWIPSSFSFAHRSTHSTAASPSPCSSSGCASRAVLLQLPRVLLLLFRTQLKSKTPSEQKTSPPEERTGLKMKLGSTPDRIKVPKAFEHPERYMSPTDRMISPVSKGLILARSRRSGSLLPPSVNQSSKILRGGVLLATATLCLESRLVLVLWLGRLLELVVVAVPSIPKQAHLNSSADEVINSLYDLRPELWGLPPFEDCKTARPLVGVDCMQGNSVLVDKPVCFCNDTGRWYITSRTMAHGWSSH